MNEFNQYEYAFSHLRRGSTVYGPAPHKLVLLLAIIQAFEANQIQTNRIEPSDRLVAAFQLIWNKYIHSGHKLNFALPFYHLSNEGFWHLHAFSGKETELRKQSTIGSIALLRRIIQYASLDSALFAELNNPARRETLKQALINALIQDSAGECPFCQIPDADVIDENDLALAFYDRYPVSPGHTLIIPKRHVASFFSLNRDEIWMLNELSLSCKTILQDTYHPTGFNLGVNVGQDAGQSVFHCHVHLIPRYHGDVANPLGGVRGVIPEKQHYL